jgi:hypothetical protein
MGVEREERARRTVSHTIWPDLLEMIVAGGSGTENRIVVDLQIYGGAKLTLIANR